METAIPNRVRIGAFEFDGKAGELRTGHRQVCLQEQPFQILLMLVERSGGLVTRQEIQKKLWPNDTVVEFDHSIHAAINKLRQAFGDSAEHPKYIETVARRGYRLIVLVERVYASPASPPLEVSATPVPEPSASSLSGKKVSHYRVLELLGGGGMGVVYKAEDLRLSRRVALKFLPEEIANDAKVLDRFEREARAASALDHPNICAIYEFGEHEGRPFIAMSLLEGQTLRDRIAARAAPCATDELLNLAIQIGHGLAAAHEKGITHRDIKPANIFITNRSEAKILDFGLAKLADTGDFEGIRHHEARSAEPQTESANDRSLSLTGVAMGTVPYMSPEQVRGEKLDARTDLYSFGLVVYEMATGTRAFSGDTSAALHEAILNRTAVPARELNPEVPPRLEEVINKALEKDRDLRYQSASEMRADLECLRRETDSGRIASLGSGVVQSSADLARKRYAVLAVCVALLAAAFAAYHFWPRTNTPSSPARITQISQWNKPMNNARLSPDGRTVAFVSPVGGIAQVFLMLTSGGEPLQLTNDEGDKVVDTFSLDGTEIYYRGFLGQNEVWAVPTFGGAPRRVVPGNHAVLSPDGSSIFYAKAEGSGIFRAGKSGVDEELVYSSQGTGLVFFPLLLFPGGNDLLAAGFRDSSWNFSFYKINVSRHKAIDLGEVTGTPFGAAWDKPGKIVLFPRTVNGLWNIWNYNLEDRSLTQITSGAGPDYSPMPDPGGKGIYFVNGKSSGILTVYHVHSKVSMDIASEEATEPMISSDGKRVKYIKFSARDRNELWVSDIDGGNKVKIATGEKLETIGTWAPDNFHLSFQEKGADGGYKAYIVGADGSGLRQLPSTGVAIWWTAWSPDQKTIYVTGVDSAGSMPTVWKLSMDGSNPEKFVDNCCIAEDVDPGGQYVLGIVSWGEKTGVYEVSTSDKKCIPLLPGVVTLSATFGRDGRSFLYAVASRGEVTIYRQSWRDGKLVGAPQVALKLPFAFPLFYRNEHAYDFSRDLSTVVYTRPSGQAELYLLRQK